MTADTFTMMRFHWLIFTCAYFCTIYRICLSTFLSCFAWNLIYHILKVILPDYSSPTLILPPEKSPSPSLALTLDLNKVYFCYAHHSGKPHILYWEDWGIKVENSINRELNRQHKRMFACLNFYHTGSSWKHVCMTLLLDHRRIIYTICGIFKEPS